ncbi:MAG: Na(+)-translocating NADH-quinone reductase subunit A [Bacteroidales bacterium]|nr:Na(+)-translocating NADH-quinone reductase subunit A [Bacteroidales bacterium]MCF8389742.1 Na(+)-translocating NADH-quinone reductase subunit A [Bacteroidales bacterium]
MSEIIRIKKGLDIKLKGKADKIYQKAERASEYSVKPTDFIGVMPKLVVKVDDKVKVGSTLFFDKYNPRVKFTSPVSGKISSVNRGERRRILEVVIAPDDTDSFVDFKIGDLGKLSREQIIELLLESGMWPSIIQRPFAVIANPELSPKAIFISGFDSSPLAPDYDFMLKDSQTEFQKGIDVLSKLTDGKVHLSVDASYPATETYSMAKNVSLHKFKGPHPAGNPGIQIHHIDPVNKGEVVWHVNPAEVVRMGKLFMEGKVDNTISIAVAGSEVLKPAYFKAIRGAAVESIISGNITEGNNRIISGNVLTGTRLSKAGFLGYYDHMISVIPEGDHFDFIGWASLGIGKYSVSRTFWSWLTPNKEFKIDTNLKGGVRAFVMSGEYEKVFPMDILPVHLLKAIIVEDIDKMEKLGIYELAEEDMALCEFVCTSKIEVQKILREGLNLMKKETE